MSFKDKVTKVLNQSKFLRNVLTLSKGTALGQMIILLASPILTRIYTPDEFGILGVYVAMLAILVKISSLQYDMTITLPKSKSDGAALVVLSFVILFVISILSGALLLLCHKQVSLLFNIENMVSYLYLLPISLIGIGGYEILSKWSIRKGNYSIIAKTKVTQMISMVCAQVGGGLVMIGAFPLLLGDALGRMGGSGRLLLNIVKEDASVFRTVTISQIKRVLIRYKKFPLYSSVSALVRQTSAELPSLFLIIFYGPTVVGSFVLVQRILSVPLNLIGTAIENVFLAETSKLSHHQPEKIKLLFWKIMRSIFIFNMPIMAIVGVTAPWFFPFIFGQNWKEAGIYVSILSIMYFLKFLAYPFASIVLVLERQDLQFIREFVRIAVMIIAFAYAVAYDISALGAIGLVSLAGSIGYIVYGIASVLAIYEFRFKKLKRFH